MSFLKQLLTPFVEFEEDKKKQPAKGNQPVAIPVPPATPVTPAASPVSASTPLADVNAQHPLINASATVANIPNQVPTYSPGGTLSGPLPEHEQYFERLIDEANAKKIGRAHV